MDISPWAQAQGMLMKPLEKMIGNEASRPSRKQRGEALNCPRCDSTNTKFCYYNNYSLSQPRHFCRTCRRYWTEGGTLRNIPVGGGSRKSKHSSPFSSSSSSSSKRTHSTISSAAAAAKNLKPSETLDLTRRSLQSNSIFKGIDSDQTPFFPPSTSDEHYEQWDLGLYSDGLRLQNLKPPLNFSAGEILLGSGLVEENDGIDLLPFKHLQTNKTMDAEDQSAHLDSSSNGFWRSYLSNGE